MKRPPVPFVVWIAGDGSRILGIGLSEVTAHRDALARHGPTHRDQPGLVEGYAARMTVDYAPDVDAAGHNPIVALKNMIEQGRREAPPHPFTPTPRAKPLEDSPKEDPKSEEKSAKAPKNGRAERAE